MTNKKNKSSKADGGPSKLADLATKAPKPSRVGFGTRFRNYFLTGLVVVGPVGITLYLGYTFIGWVDDWVKPYIPSIYNPDTYLPFALPGAGLVFALIGLAMIGALAANLLGRTVISYGELFMSRMPVVRNLYSALKQIFETVLSQSNTSFQDVALIEYPRKGLYALVFVSTKTTGEIRERSDGQEFLSVFLPTTPNPTSGFLLFVPEKDVVILDMSVEEGAKLVISAGLVVPEYQETLAELAEGHDIDVVKGPTSSDRTAA